MVYNGFLREDPIKHMKDFDVICATTRITGSNEDVVKAFTLPFSLEGKAKDWKNGERKLEEQKRKNLEHSARASTPRHGASRLGVQSSSPGSDHPRLGVDSNA
ncbi:hypothetical protein PIB30_108388 [Stylosanthes scabra]|uniref:Reverse transcriptase domain-containing protein n=1 Tax=Stylosanthes scabra TaxID=79078 RepID=A0ABU6YZL1_9FABA|nr:hypothetical protein [Stylosanthes scabra]